MLFRVTLMMLLTVGMFVAACGGGGGGSDPTPTYPPDFTPWPAGLLTPGPPPSIDPDMEFKLFQGETRPYEMLVPPDWQVKLGVDIDQFTFEHPDRGLVAYMQVSCSNGQVGNVIKSDGDILQRGGVPYTSGQATEITLDGRYAIRFPYVVHVGSNTNTYQWVYYIEGISCPTWRLRTVTVGQPPVEDYERLYDRIAESFHERQ